MRYALACVLFIATPAAAESLLLELGWENPEPVTLPARYTFAIGNLGGNGAVWHEDISSLPDQSVASSQLVERFNQQLTGFEWGPLDSLYPVVSLSVAIQAPELPRICTSCYWSRLVANLDDSGKTGPEWAAFAESVGWNVNLEVPLLGQGLLGYEITSIEREVTAAEQTVRIFGQRNPDLLPGDFNDDGMVDAADYVTWRKMPPAFQPLAFRAWRANFGMSANGASAALVPEPASWLLACLALCCIRRTMR
jgi:hypothetical protein